LKRVGKSLPVFIAVAALAWSALVGCAPQGPFVQQGVSVPRETPQDGQPGIAGHKWRVTAIDHNGKETPVPAKYSVYLSFAPDGDFSANDSVNYHSGTYRLVDGGFTTNKLVTTAAGYAGKDPVVALAASAVSAFDPGVHATASVTGKRLKVTVDGYLLDCQPGEEAGRPGEVRQSTRTSPDGVMPRASSRDAP
jgi:heat shock protein HslJ